jgi:probable HAF family extracellular repeat protein
MFLTTCKASQAQVPKWALGFLLTVACQSAFAQAMYRIKSFGYLGGCTTSVPGVVDLNDADQVTGRACNANGDSHAFLWKNDGTPMVDLGPSELGSTSSAYALNASGQVAGMATDSGGSFGFVSSSNGASMTQFQNSLGGVDFDVHAINDLGQVTGYAALGTGVTSAYLWKNDGSPMIDLEPHVPFQADSTFGLAINNAGQVAGNDTYDGEPGSELVVWKNDGTPLLFVNSASYPYAINASGQVAGVVAAGGGVAHGFLWANDGTAAKDLGTLAPNNNGGSAAKALNDAGQMAGWADTRWFGNRRAVVWMHGATSIQDLGTGTGSQSNDINASGQVTGQGYFVGDPTLHAFLWRNDGTKAQDLNALIDPTDPLKPYITLTNGRLINKSGDILADGTDSRTGISASYLLQGTVLTMTPRSLAFGNHAIHTISAAKSVTVTNTSPKAAAISSVALTGTAAGQFAQTNNCGKSLAGHATCAIKVTFKPTTKGAKSGFLYVNGGGGGLRSVTLTGTGT